MVVAHEVQLPQLVKKLSDENNRQGNFFIAYNHVLWGEAHSYF